MAITQKQGLDIEALEGIVDRHGMAGVLEMLSHICSEKSEHLISNWQDKQSAQWWDARATACDKLAARPFMHDAG